MNATTMIAAVTEAILDRKIMDIAIKTKAEVAPLIMADVVVIIRVGKIKEVVIIKINMEEGATNMAATIVISSSIKVVDVGDIRDMVIVEVMEVTIVIKTEEAITLLITLVDAIKNFITSLKLITFG